MITVSEILQRNKKIHDRVENTDFVKRYNNKLSLLTHYLHLTQLLKIYQQLEAKLSSSSNPNINTFCQPRLFRAASIQADLDFWHPYLSKTEKDMIESQTLPAVKEIVNFLNQAKNTQLLAIFVTLILAVAFGGQKIKRKLIQLHHKVDTLSTIKPFNNGMLFYQLDDDLNAKSLRKTLEGLNFTTREKKIFLTATSFIFHKYEKLLNELEVISVNIEKARNEESLRHAKAHHRFSDLSQNYRLFPRALVSTAIAGAAMAGIYYYYHK